MCSCARKHTPRHLESQVETDARMWFELDCCSAVHAVHPTPPSQWMRWDCCSYGYSRCLLFLIWKMMHPMAPLIHWWDVARFSREISHSRVHFDCTMWRSMDPAAHSTKSEYDSSCWRHSCWVEMRENLKLHRCRELLSPIVSIHLQVSLVSLLDDTLMTVTLNLLSVSSRMRWMTAHHVNISTMNHHCQTRVLNCRRIASLCSSMDSVESISHGYAYDGRMKDSHFVTGANQCACASALLPLTVHSRSTGDCRSLGVLLSRRRESCPSLTMGFRSELLLPHRMAPTGAMVSRECHCASGGSGGDCGGGHRDHCDFRLICWTHCSLVPLCLRYLLLPCDWLLTL